MHKQSVVGKLLAAVIAASALLASGTAMACSCRSADLARNLADADVVLVARVTAFKPLDQATLTSGEVFKGVVPKVFTIQTGQSDCDYFLPPVHPKAGDRFLLFLRQAEGRLTASRCLPSGPIADKAAELRALRRQFPAHARTGAALDLNVGVPPARSSPFHAALRH